MKDKKFDVTGLGSLAVDFIGNIEKWPEIGTKNPFLGFDIYDGGLTGTALSAVSRLGGKASFIGRLGVSDMAQRAFKSLEKEGIDLSNLIRDEISEPIISFVLSNSKDEQRNIFFRKENLNFPFQHQIPDQFWYKKTKVFFTDHVAGSAGLEAVKIAAKNNLPVIVDIERMQDNTEDLLGLANHIVVSEGFAREYSGSGNSKDQLKSLKKHSSQYVIITMGKNGCLTANGAESIKIPGIRVNVKDTTGCGDTFHGAYALEIARGKDMVSAARTANFAAAMCAMETGGRIGIPNYQQLKIFQLNQLKYN